MSSLARTIDETEVRPGSVMTWWLGGTGFVFKIRTGMQIFVDPYFSNCVARIFGVERAFPPPIRADEARPDLVVTTHWHEDHLDPEGIPVVAKHSRCRFMGPPSCVSRMLGWGIPRDRVISLSVEQTHEFEGVTITSVAARHVAGVPGWETHDAIGLLLDFDGLRVYHSGDTEYDLRLRALAYDARAPIHACMLVINGVGGNMNAHEAALLAWQLGARIVIPMHHILWKDFSGGEQATLDPHLLADTYRRLGGTGEVKIIEVGEGICLQGDRTLHE
jgi:L-ascorbate metabolism protein UlaG (beta-lactamase superfamily)